MHNAWLKWSNLASEPIRDSIAVIQDFPPGDSAPSGSQISSPRRRKKSSYGIAQLDVDYAVLKPYVEKAKAVVDFEREGACAVCREELEHDAGIYAICPNHACEAVTHLACLSNHFLNDEKDPLIPIKGTCPICKTESWWVDIVKELSLRLRGHQEIGKLLREKRIRKVQAVAPDCSVLASSGTEEDPDDMTVEREIETEINRIRDLNPGTHDFDMGDSWHILDDSEHSNTEPAVSSTSRARKATSYQTSSTAQGLVTVVEDSDWDDVEGLD